MNSKAFKEVQTDPIAPAVQKRLLADLNLRFSAVLLAFAWRICNKESAVSAKATNIDNSGLVLSLEDKKGKKGIARVMFDERLKSGNVQEQFNILHKRAVAPFLPKDLSPFLAFCGLWIALPLVAFPFLSESIEPLHRVNGMLLEYALGAGIPLVSTVADLQRIFYIAVGAHVLEVMVAAYLLTTRLYVSGGVAFKWYLLVFIFGFPVLGLVLQLCTRNTLAKLKSQ